MSISNTQSVCFLCKPFANNVTGYVRKSFMSSRQLNPVVTKHLFKYLVGFEAGLAKTNQELHQQLLLQRNNIVLCSRCENLADKMSTLHLELEVVQMKINNLAETIRHIVGVAAGSDKAPVKSPLFNLMRQFQDEVAKNIIYRSLPSTPLVVLDNRKFAQSPTRYSSNENLKTEPENDLSCDSYLESIEIDGMDSDYDPHDDQVEDQPDESMGEDSDYEPEEMSFSKPRVRNKSPKSINPRKPNKSKNPLTLKHKKPEKSSSPQTCQLCSTSSHNLRAFEQHLRTHETIHYFHNCPHCPLQFTQEQLFKIHLNSHNTTRKCDICLEPVTSADMITHLQTHQEQLYQCPDCSYAFGKFSSLVLHAKFHNKKPIKCQLCPGSSNISPWYTTRPKLITHLYTDHKLPDMFPCPEPLCSRAFFTESGKLSHVKKMHVAKTPNKHKCDECPMTFYEERLLITHKIKGHGAPKLKCQVCSNEYKSPTSLRRHAQSHELDKNGQGAYPCDKCDKVFKRQGCLWAHKQVHKEKNFSCDECGYLAISSRYLQRHKLKHIKEKLFECSICSKRYAAKSYLRSHQRIHEKKHQCEQCGKNFAIAGHLKNHLRTHHGSDGLSGD